MRKYPKYVRTADGEYVGRFVRLEYGEFPVYRFPGGCRLADDWEIEHGADDLDRLTNHSHPDN